ncbi:AcaB family transcriptional regulator [Citrobacter koseri]
MSDKTEKKAGDLHSELRIELHTQYAINTWSGRPASDGKPSLIGMPLFFRLISRINRDSLADVALVEVETLLETASQCHRYRVSPVVPKRIQLQINRESPYSEIE